MQLLEQELWKLARSEISCCRRSRFNVHLASIPWICDTHIATGAAKGQYR
jgi:hypothetical protein